MSRILVVDDEPLIRDTLEILLENSGYEVESAEGGDDAARLLREKNFDLVLTDIRMPHGDGLELCRRAHTIDKNIPVVFMTGYSDLEEKDLAALGAQGLISKPFELELVLTRLKALLHHAQDQ